MLRIPCSVLQQVLPHNAVAVEYPQHTLKATLICNSHSCTVLYETYVAIQTHLDVEFDEAVSLIIMENGWQ